jgi:ferredoxin--NADP+ reductase
MMYEILRKEKWHDILYSMWVNAPYVAEAAEPGQFVVLIIDERGERIPLTIADYDREEGWIQVVFQTMGKTTTKLAQMNEGDELFSFVGPLGNPSEIEKYRTVVTVGGGTGIACVYSITKALKEAGNRVIAIIGARTKDLIIMEDGCREDKNGI